jgi:glycerol-3-phosphate dehydrogenase (NAD(P)+)
MAAHLAFKGFEVTQWCREADVVEDINKAQTNTRFLPGLKLSENHRATGNLLEAVEAKSLVILATPSLFLLNLAKEMQAAESIREGRSIIAVLTKGFLQTDAGPRLILETLEDYLPGFYRGKLVYISGPSHAEEVALGKLTGLIAASENAHNSIAVREALKTERLLVFSSFDVTGVQIAAAAKNVEAIAFGMLDALKTDGKHDYFGDNTESLLLAAALNEMQDLGAALGASHRQTFSSIAGVGDLDVTCRSIYGRNRRFGRDIVEKNILGPFKDLKDMLSRINELPYLPEGAAAAESIHQLLHGRLSSARGKHGRKLKMPIAEGVYHILNKETTPLDYITDILQF